MIISLKKTKYNTNQLESREKLKKDILLLHEKGKVKSLKAITAQIEQAKILTRADIEIYRQVKLIEQSEMPIRDIEYGYFTSKKLTNTRTKFIYIDSAFFPLPDVQKVKYYPYALIDKLLYEAARNDWNKPPCTVLRKMICRFIPESIHWKEPKFSKKLSKCETDEHTYFGEYPSDDSDSDEETEFAQRDQKEKKQIRRKARGLRERAGVQKYRERLAYVEDPPKPDLKARATIQRKTEANRRQIQRGLKTINKAFDENRLDDKLLASLETKFLVAQYRGIHYLTTNWDKVARQKHREKDEKGR